MSEENQNIQEDAENDPVAEVTEVTEMVDDQIESPTTEELTANDEVTRFYVGGRFVREFTLAEQDELKAAVTRQQSLNNTVDTLSFRPGSDDAQQLDESIRVKRNQTQTGA